MTSPRVLILASALDSAPRCVHLGRPMTVAEVVEAQAVRLDLPTIAVLTDPAGNSRPVMRGEWNVRQVAPGHQLSFVPVPAGGSLKSVLAAVASIALAIIAPWAAGALAGMLGFTAGTTAFSIASGIIGSGIMIAGQFIISRLLPQQSNTNLTAETVYTARASNNRAMPNEPIPELFGRLRYPPPYAARPYAEFIDNDQHLYQLHCMSIGDVDVQRWEIGDTLVWTKESGFHGAFAGGDTEIEIVRPGGEITLFPANVVSAPTVDGQQVPDAPAWLGPFAVSAPGIEVKRIVCDYVFPLGLIHIDKKGRGGRVARTVRAEYRKIDNAGNPVGSWQTLIDHEHRAATRTPQRFSRGMDVATGRYEVRFGASGADQSDNTGKTSTLNRILWAGLRGYVEGFETPPDCTLVATKIRATENLSRDAAGQYFFTCQRLLPVWSEANGWSAPVATRSPAWAAAQMLRSLGISDAEYDLGWLAAFAAVWEARGDRFDAIFDRRWQASEALDAILRVGRSYHVRLGSMIGFVRDEPRQVRRMAFTPDSIVRGSIKRHDVWFSEDAPDHLEVVYLDGETWQERQLIAAIGAVGRDKPQQHATFGITGHDHAWREGIFQAAENAFRRSFRTFQVEREGRMVVRGDPVVLADPLHELVGFGRLVDRTGDVLTLDREMPVEPGETYHVAIRDKLGREWGPCLVSSIDGAQITLDAADRAVVEAQHGTLAARLPDPSRQEPAHVTLVAGEDRLFDGLLVEAKPVGPELWEVTLVNDDQRVHAVDQTEPIPAPWTPPAMIAPVPESPTVRGVYGLLQQGTLGLTLEAGWQPAAGADRYVAEISYDEDAAADPAAASWTPVHDSRATRLSIVAMPQPVTLRVAGVGKVQGEWAYAVVTAVPELRLPDEVVDPLTQEIYEWFGDMSDWTDPESPFYPLGQEVLGLDEKVDLLQGEIADLVGAEEYNPAHTYLEGALVQFEGGLYRAIQNVPAATPPSDATYWEKIGDYASLGEAVVALSARLDEAETEIEQTADGFISTTRDSRRIYNALMVDAIAEIEKTGATAFEARDQLDAAAIAARWTETEISRVDGVLTVHAADIAMVQATLGTKADVSVTQAMQATITQQGDEITSLGGLINAIGNDLGNLSSNLTTNHYTKTETDGVASSAAAAATSSLYAALNGLTEPNAVATAFSQQLALITAQGDNITAQASRTDDLFVALGGSTNNVRLKFEAAAGPSGYSRLKAIGRTTGFADRMASFGFDVPNNAALPIRTWVQGDQFLILDTNGNLIAMFGADGQTIQNIRLGTLFFDQLQSNNGKLIMRGADDDAYIEGFS